MRRASEIKFQEVELPAQVHTAALTRAFKISRTDLQELNPGLRPLVWQGRRQIPKGYRLRLPAAGRYLWTCRVADQASGKRAADQSAATTRHPRTAATACRYPRPTKSETAGAGAIPTVAAQIESARDAEAVAMIGKPAARAEAVTAAQAEKLSPSLGPAIETPSSARIQSDYSIGATRLPSLPMRPLGHYAEWLGTSATRLRQSQQDEARAGRC